MVKYRTKKSLVETLRTMAIGSAIHIPEKDFKYDVVRHTAYRLKDEGIDLVVSCRDTLGTNVTRLR